MKTRHNFVAYIFPTILIIMSIAASTDPEIGYRSIISALLILVLVAINYFTVSLEIDGGVVKGRKGLIKKTVLSTPIKNISYCELTTFLIFNKIKINAITGHYEFKNMKNAKEFVDMVNNRQA